MTLPLRRARSTTDPTLFDGVIRPLVSADPVGFNVLATNVSRAITHPAGISDALWFWVETASEDGGWRVTSAGMHTPPFKPFVVTEHEADAEALADLLAATDRPCSGVVGTLVGSQAFARRWAQSHPVRVEVAMRTGLYELGDLVVPAGIAGSARVATMADEPVAQVWARRFTDDIGSPEHDPETVRYRLSTGRLWFWEVDGEPVSQAFANLATEGFARIGWVYTPDALRGRGYGSAITAHVTARCLDDGDRCMLHTDLANPTSNKIYVALGYRRVGSDADLEFVPTLP